MGVPLLTVNSNPTPAGPDLPSEEPGRTNGMQYPSPKGGQRKGEYLFWTFRSFMTWRLLLFFSFIHSFIPCKPFYKASGTELDSQDTQRLQTLSLLPGTLSLLPGANSLEGVRETVKMERESHNRLWGVESILCETSKWPNFLTLWNHLFKQKQNTSKASVIHMCKRRKSWIEYISHLGYVVAFGEGKRIRRIKTQGTP